MLHRLRIAALSLAISGALLGGCAQTPGASQASLYDRLGGKEAITAVVDKLAANVAADPRVNHRFANANITRFKSQMVDLLCQASGGPCVYNGPHLRVVHKGMQITDAEFTAVAENAAKTLDSFNVPTAERNAVLNLLASLKGDVVGH